MAQDVFVGSIFMFGGNYAIRGTMICAGQLLSIQQNTALFSLLGTTYGGNGQQTFALPNLLGRCVMHPNSDYPLGAEGGSEKVSLSLANIPQHNHNGVINAAIPTGGNATTATAIGSLPGDTSTGTGTALYANTADSGFMTPMNATLNSPTGAAGSSQPHENMQPYLAITFLIATEGIFPTRN